MQGLVILWSGTENTVPSGWFVCNGSNGTPDLRSRFVVGAGSTYNLSSTGGSANSIVPTHNHIVSSVNSGGSHGHSWPTNRSLNNPGTGTIATGLGTTYRISGYGTMVSDARSGSAHTHSAISPTGTAGSDPTNTNLPPYYSLFFIMKGGN